jgi:signal transduction histidine kinase
MRILLLLIFLVFGLSSVPAQKTTKIEPDTPARILMLSPFNASQVQYYQMSSSFMEQLNHSGESYFVDQYYLDSSYPPYTKEKIAELEAYLDAIRRGKYKVVVTFYGPALDLIKKHIDEFPQDVSVIACELPSSIKDTVPRRKNLYYLFFEQPVEKNIRLVHQLFPKRRNIILLTNWNLDGAECRKAAIETHRNYPAMRLLIPDNEKMNAEELVEYVSKFRDDTVLLFQGWYNQKAVNASSILQLINAISSQRSDLPLFIMHSALLRYRTLGGYMEDGTEIGVAAAELTMKLIANEDVPHERRTLSCKLFLKESMLEHYGLSRGYVPAIAKILGREETFLEMHREYIFLGLATIICLLLIAISAIVTGVRYRQMLRRLRNIFLCLKMRIIVVNFHDEILLYHDGKEVIWGENAMFGHRMRKIQEFPEEVNESLRAAIHEVMAYGQPRTCEYELHGRHQIANFVRLPDGIFREPCILGTAIDIDDIHNLTLNEKIQKDCMAAVLPENNASASFSTIMKLFCEHFHGDRCYLIHYNGENEAPSLVEEYCAPGNEPAVISFIKKYHDRLGSWFVRVHENKVIEYVPDPADQTDAERARPKCRGEHEWLDILQQHDVKHMYVMQIYLHGKVWGSWGLVYKHSRGILSNVQKQVIPTIAKMIELILMRQEYVNALSTARDEAQTASRAKSTFLATMSHELRTPLNAVIGYAELLGNNADMPVEQRDYVAGIHFAAKSLLGLINNILDFSKIESEQSKVVLVPTNIKNSFEELRMTYRQMASDKALDMSFECSPDMPLLMIDARYVRQILVNLVGNAIKYTDSGSVKVRAEYKDTTLTFTVRDTGRGVSENMQAQIFKPFVQSENGSETKKGTGLGLTISSRLAKLMGGQLTLKSKLGEGSTFTLTLNNVKPSVTNVSKPATVSEPTPLNKIPDVLLVDDSPINLRVFEAMFKSRGIPVSKAASGQEALELLHSHKFDIVFTDLRMPGMSGLELVRRIRAYPEMAQTKVVAVTADILFNNENEEFDDTLLKPASLDQLMAIMRKLLM